MFSCMCKFVFVKENSNNLHCLGRSKYMSSRGIANSFFFKLYIYNCKEVFNALMNKEMFSIIGKHNWI